MFTLGDIFPSLSRHRQNQGFVFNFDKLPPYFKKGDDEYKRKTKS